MYSASVSGASQWEHEFAIDRFGAKSSEYALYYSKEFLKAGDNGRAVLELEPMLVQGWKENFSFADTRNFLYTNPEFLMDVFRATEERGIEYYKCVLGAKRAKQLLMLRLNNYGSPLSSEIREERLRLVERIDDSNQYSPNVSTVCENQRRAYTDGWSEEVDAIYKNNEKVIRAAELKYAEEQKTLRAEKAEKDKMIKKEGVAIRSRLRPYNLALSEVSVYEYGGSTGFRVSVLNLSSKRIKYLNLTVVGVNAVGDVVVDRLKGRRLRFRGIGPIESGESASYSENIMWFTDVVDRARIEALTIEYMDGSVISVKSPMSLLLKGQDFDILTLDLMTTR